MSYAAQIISIRYLELPPFDRCLSVVTFCQINLSRVSTPALSTPTFSAQPQRIDDDTVAPVKTTYYIGAYNIRLYSSPVSLSCYYHIGYRGVTS